MAGPAEAPATRIRFGECELDRAARELRRAGAVVTVQPRVFDLLLHLIDHRDRAVSKDELVEAVWNGVIVGDAAISQAAKEARRAVGDDGNRQEIVQTVRRHGYRFVGEFVAVTDGAQTGVAPVEPTSSSDEDDFIGREALRDELDGDLGVIRRGQPVTVLIAGEPGVGKSRVLSQVERQALAQGIPVFSGRAAEDEGAPPYWPWIQVLRGALASPGVLDRLPTDARFAVAWGIPELAPLLGLDEHPTESWKLEAEQQRFRLFDAISQILRGLAPAVVLLDDIHASDVPSLRLVSHLTRFADAAVLLVGAYRDMALQRDEARRDLVGSVGRAPHARATVLEGLTRDEVAEYVRRVAGDAPSESMLDSLEERTRGNPFFLSQILRVRRTRGLEEGWTGPLPGGIVDALEQHLEVLSDETRRTLRTAAMMGRDFDPSMLARLDRASSPHDAIEEAVAARVLEPAAGGTGWLRFAHALIREALASRLSAAQKLEIHEALIGAIEGTTGEDGPRFAELAHHAHEAACLGGDMLRAVRYSTDAARRCRSQLAFEEEARHLERAIHAVDLGAEVAEDERLDLRMQLARANVHCGDLDAGLSGYSRVANRAIDLGHGERAVRASIAYEETGFAIGERYLRDPEAIRQMERSLEILGDESTELQAHAESRLARRLYYRGEYEEAVDLARGAADRATRGLPPRIEARALESLAFVLWRPEQLDDRIAAARGMLNAALRGDDLATVLDAHGLLSLVLMESSDVDAVRTILSETTRLIATERWVSPWRRWMFELQRGALHLLEGRLEQVARGIRALEADVERLQRADASLMLQMQRVQLHWFQGDLDQDVPMFDFLAELPYPRPSLAASGYVLAGRLDEARACWDRFIGPALQSSDALQVQNVLGALGMVCVALRDEAHASELYDRLLPWRRYSVVVRPVTTYSGSMERVLGGLADVAGRPVEAREHYETSLRLHDTIGAVPWGVLDRVDLALLLERHGPRKHAARIKELGRDAQAGADRVGSPMLQEKVAELNPR